MKKDIREKIKKTSQKFDALMSVSLSEVYSTAKASNEVNEIYNKYLCHKKLIDAFTKYEEDIFAVIMIEYLNRACQCHSNRERLDIAEEIYMLNCVPAKMALKKKQKATIISMPTPVQKKLGKMAQAKM